MKLSKKKRKVIFEGGIDRLGVKIDRRLTPLKKSEKSALRTDKSMLNLLLLLNLVVVVVVVVVV